MPRNASPHSYPSISYSNSFLNEECPNPQEDISNDDTEVSEEQPISLHRKPVNKASGSMYELNPYQGAQPGDPTSRSPSSRSSRYSSFRDWWLETVCCFIAVAAVMAIVATVYPFSGQTLPQWPYGLSINSLISIYVVILKVAMMVVIGQGLSQLKWTWFQQVRPLADLEIYDSASRGGIISASSLLYRLQGKHVVPSLGALAIIFATVTDPVAQQLIRYDTCQYVVGGSSATIPRVNAYAMGGGYSGRTGSITGTLPSEMQGFINQGLFNPGGVSIPFHCSTGNCTIPNQYHSMAYCSACMDVTDEIKITGKSLPKNHTLPSGLSSIPGEAAFVVGTAQPGSSNAGSIEFITTAASEFKIGGECKNNDTWPCRDYGAARCQLFPCTKTYSANITGTRLEESHLSSNWQWGPETDNLYISSLDMSCVNDTEKNSLRSFGYKFDDETTWLAYNVSYDPNPENGWAYSAGAKRPSNATLQAVRSTCIYQELIVFENSLPEFLTTFFTGSYAVGAGESGGTNSVVSTLFQGGNVSFESVSSTMKNVSIAMTALIRTNGVLGRSEPAMGSVLQDETCVAVRWAWIAFPAAMVALTLVFFVAVVIQTRPKDASSHHDYKSSVLALMFHGLEQSTQDRHRPDMGRASMLSKEARRVYVRLGPTERGWKLVETMPN